MEREEGNGGMGELSCCSSSLEKVKWVAWEEQACSNEGRAYKDCDKKQPYLTSYLST